MSRLTSHVVLAALAVFALVDFAHAQLPPPTPVDPIPVPGPGYPPPSSRPFLRCLNSHGLGCWSHHTVMGCGSFHSEFGFIFGSCRYYFGDRCIPQPPHSDRDPYWRSPCNGDRIGYFGGMPYYGERDAYHGRTPCKTGCCN